MGSGRVDKGQGFLTTRAVLLWNAPRVLTRLSRRRLTNAERVSEGKAMLLRVVAMLTKLVDRFDEGSSGLREDAESYDHCAFVIIE